MSNKYSKSTEILFNLFLITGVLSLLFSLIISLINPELIRYNSKEYSEIFTFFYISSLAYSIVWIVLCVIFANAHRLK